MTRIFASAALLVALVSCTDCKPATGPGGGPDGGLDGGPNAGAYIEGGAAIANGICSLVEGTDNGIVRTICASIDEVANMVAFILTLRSNDIEAGVSPRAQEACAQLPGSKLCATSAERAKAIVFVSRVRDSRRMLDGGAAR